MAWIFILRIVLSVPCSRQAVRLLRDAGGSLAARHRARARLFDCGYGGGARRETGEGVLHARVFPGP